VPADNSPPEKEPLRRFSRGAPRGDHVRVSDFFEASLHVLGAGRGEQKVKDVGRGRALSVLKLRQVLLPVNGKRHEPQAQRIIPREDAWHSVPGKRMLEGLRFGRGRTGARARYLEESMGWYGWILWRVTLPLWFSVGPSGGSREEAFPFLALPPLHNRNPSKRRTKNGQISTGKSQTVQTEFQKQALHIGLQYKLLWHQRQRDKQNHFNFSTPTRFARVPESIGK
jgi:hypothetical protein